MEDIEEKDDPLVSFDEQTSSDVLMMLPEDIESELQQMMDDTSRRIDNMETKPVAEDRVITGDLLGFEPSLETATQPNISDNPFDLNLLANQSETTDHLYFGDGEEKNQY